MLRLRDLTCGYGRSAVVHGIDLEVGADEVVSVMGHNGAGKTTLLRAVVGLLPAMSGTVELAGEDVTRRAANKRVKAGMAYVPQGQQCFAHLTAGENLRLVADGRKRGRALVDEQLDLFPALRPLLARQAGLLSGGQRQQLAIARALITEPRLLILDEPTEGIQPNVVAEIESTIVDLAKRGGLAVLLVEQHLGFALQAADRYYVLRSGRVASAGATGAGAETSVREAMAI
ncbi:urea ABC transporter ATP-binding subunit UrtE [Glycomyces terrestris]|uniref:Urea ABC transporter ATP-binding subunit UrtE n=1 Tax=Glycomyces terrestris TaxID=2493553 RepID=A0A426UVQ4_9ACTN|nr:urea ABC transporter ATP-binding subunit UrtE [Glycomyces terrestris]RRR98394.1 urea ABC transporter ATP-binding subunit UrtE [Glycomyces terrestris]